MIIDSDDIKLKILKNFLEISVFEGWNDSAIELAIKKTFPNQEILPNQMPIIFEDGIYSLISFVSKNRCETLAEISSKNPDFNDLKLNAKINYLIFQLLKIDENNKGAFKRLLNFYLVPKNPLNDSINCSLRPVNQAFKEVYFVADYLWKLCNDKSSDFNFYSKRIILSKVLIRSFMFFLNDNSLNNINTQKFIDKEIEKILKFNQYKLKAKYKINEFSNKIDDIIYDSNHNILDIKSMIKNLPFIRLFNK
ncbi:MAG: COQ9 family protein [Rickettsiales bacterium]